MSALISGLLLCEMVPPGDGSSNARKVLSSNCDVTILGIRSCLLGIIDTTKKIIYAPVRKRNYKENNEELDKS